MSSSYINAVVVDWWIPSGTLDMLKKYVKWIQKLRKSKLYL